MNFDQDDEDICRVCRNGSTPDNQLSYPCKCSGSIKYIHKQCLLEWIQHSKSSSCELCGHPFRFTPIYSENAPEFIPLSELIMEAMIRLKWYIKRFARVLYIIFCWLFIVPTLTCWIFNFFFGQKWFLSNQNRSEFNSINLFYDFFVGTMLFFWIILATVVSYIILDFLHHKLSEIEIQSEYSQQIHQNNLNNIDDIEFDDDDIMINNQPQAQQDNVVNNNDNNVNNVNNEEVLPNNLNVNDVYNDMLQQPPVQPPPQPQPQPQQQRVLFRIPGVFEMLRVQDVPEDQQQNANNQQQNNDININNLDDDNNDDIEHFIGLSGPLSNIITNCIILILFNGVFILVFLYYPYLFGQSIQNILTKLTHHSIKLSTFFEGAVNIILGYTVSSVLALFFLSFLVYKSILLKFSVLLYSFIKVIVITVVELGLLPILIGTYIDFSSLDLFGSTVQNRITYFNNNKIPFLLTRWGFGIFFMLNFTYLLSTLHQIFRKGVLWFVRDPDDPDFDLVKDMIKSSFKRHLYKISFSIFAYVLASTLLVLLPTKFLSMLPNLLPMNFDFGEPIHKSTSDVFFIFAISYFPRVDTRVTIKNIVKFWVVKVSHLLNLDGYLLPQTPPVAQQQQQQPQPQPQLSQLTVTKPDNFGLRITFFIFLGWFSLFLTVSAYLSLPVSVGRRFLYSLSNNDIYTILLGLVIIWVVGKLFYLLISNGSSINIAQWSFILSKILFLSFCLLILIPTLTGILLDLIFFIPLTTPYDESLYFNGVDILKCWGSGALILQFWYRCVTAAHYNPNNIRNNLPEDLDAPRDKWIDRFEQIKRNGFVNIDVEYTMKKVICPITHYLLTLFTVPYCISKFVVPLFGGTLALESIAFRYGFPVYCFILIAERLLLKLIDWIILFHNIIRDDKYLIGKHLHNLEEQQKSRTRSQSSSIHL